MSASLPARVTAQPAIVSGTHWWNRPTLRALLRGADKAPRFIFDFNAALTEAQRTGSHLFAWSSRLTRAQETAAAAVEVSLFRIEDGFVRSIGLGAGFVTAASLAIDQRGIYYDATRPSDIEHCLETLDLAPSEIAQGAVLRARIVQLRLSKYNLKSDVQEKPIKSPVDRDVVLVPGQVADDASIRNTQSATIDTESDENVNLQLLRTVRARHPKAHIIYKPHPDVVSGLRRGALSAAEIVPYADHVATDIDILRLIDQADHIETISSLAGFEALLRRKSVATHGLPFYAGWGLTEDLTSCPRRTRQRSLDELTAIALNHYTRHMNPITGKACSASELLDALNEQRNNRRHRMRNAILKRAAWVCERLNL